MIQIVFEEGQYRLVVTCDLCSERITEAKHGTVLFESPSNAKPVLFVQKGR